MKNLLFRLDQSYLDVVPHSLEPQKQHHKQLTKFTKSQKLIE